MTNPELLSRDWRERLSTSRELGTGFAAPGGEFTGALYEWAMTDRGNFLKDLLGGRRVIELGAGMMPLGTHWPQPAKPRILWRSNHSILISKNQWLH